MPKQHAQSVPPKNRSFSLPIDLPSILLIRYRLAALVLSNDRMCNHHSCPLRKTPIPEIEDAILADRGDYP